MSIKNLTYKQKNYLLLIGTIVFLLVIYNASIKGTVEVYSSYSELNDKKEELENAPENLIKVEKRFAELKKGYGEHETYEDAEYQELVLEKITEFCIENDLVLRSFPAPHIFGEQGFEIEINRVSVQGPFGDLLELTYHLERKYKLGRIASLHFEKRTDLKTKKRFLVVNIYMQNIKKLEV